MLLKFKILCTGTLALVGITGIQDGCNHRKFKKKINYNKERRQKASGFKSIKLRIKKEQLREECEKSKKINDHLCEDKKHLGNK